VNLKNDLSRLKWTKNVNNHHVWVYRHDEIRYSYLVPEFNLHWPKGEDANIRRPDIGDIILLRQRTKVTHLVMTLDDQIGNAPEPPTHSITRRVQVLWMAKESLKTPDDQIWDNAPSQNDVFGFDVHLEGGSVMLLENIKALNETFKDQDGVAAFQKRVAEKLGLGV